MTKALIVVDVQNDFCEGGSLAVEGGNNVAERINKFVTEEARGYYDRIIYTADWHNPLPDTNGGHFAVDEAPDFKDSWPVHCVALTEGAKFHPAIAELPKDPRAIFRKGQGRPDYSGFQGINEDGVPLAAFLRDAGIREVHTAGIAGDFCVVQTSLDALRQQFKVLLLPSLTASVGGPSATMDAVSEIVELEMSLAK